MAKHDSLLDDEYAPKAAAEAKSSRRQEQVRRIENQRKALEVEPLDAEALRQATMQLAGTWGLKRKRQGKR